MADDILQEKLFNFLCGSGGFVDLSVLLRRSSPLGSRKSANEAVIWLENQRTFALVKDGKGTVLGVRVDLKKKICQQYVSKGYCRKKEGFCKHWHICKKFIEGKCDAYFGCELSHNFHEGANSKMLKELCLVKYSNGALRNIVAWSLPQVCPWYLRGECSSYKCSYVHVCVKAIQGFSCGCSLSHRLDDTGHNLFVLKRYDLVPSNQVLNVDFVRCSVLFLGEDRPFVKQENASLGNNGFKNQSEKDLASSGDDFSTPENASLGTNGLENSEEGFSPSKDHFSTPENASLGTNGLENPEEDFAPSEDDFSTPENASLGNNGLKNQSEEDFAPSEDDFSTPENASLGTNGLENPEEDFVASEDDFSTPENASLGTNGLENPEEDFVASEYDFSTPVVATDIQTQNTGMTITSPVTGKSETENKLSQNMTKDSAATYAANIFLSSRFRVAGASDNLFRRLCKEFKCTVPLSVLHDKKVVLPNELNDFMNILQENRDKFLVTRNVQGVIHQISAFCPKLRLCSNYVSVVNECKTENCPYFHLCKDFIKGCCIYGEHCSRGHSFQNKRDRNTLLQLKLDGFTNGQLRQLLLASSPQVCIDYNGGTCMLGPFCSRVHICKEFVMNTCSRESRCLLDHDRAFQTKHTISLFENFKLNSIPFDEKLKAIFVRKGEDHGRPQKGVARSDTIDVTINTSRESATGVTSKMSTAKAADGRPKANRMVSVTSSKSDSVSLANKNETSLNVKQSSTSVTRKTLTAKDVDENSADPKTNRMAAVTNPRSDIVSLVNKNETSLNVKQLATGVTRKTLKAKDVDGNSADPKTNRMAAVTSPKSDIVSLASKNETSLNVKQSATGVTAKTLTAKDVDGNSADPKRNRMSAVTSPKSDSVSLANKNQSSLNVKQSATGVTRKTLEAKDVDGNSVDPKTNRMAAVTRPKSDSMSMANKNETSLNVKQSVTGVTRKTLTAKDVDGNSAERKMNRTAAVTSPRSDTVSVVNKNEASLNVKQSEICDTRKTLTAKDVDGNSADAKTNRMAAVTSPRNNSVASASKNKVFFNIKRSDSSTGTNCFPDEWQVFQSLCTDYDCSALFTAIGKRTDLFPDGLESAESWFRRSEGSFLIKESDTKKGKILRVKAFSTNLRLCLSWINSPTCQKRDCQCFHVCKSYITNSCSRGTSCPMNHSFHNKRDQALLSRIRLDFLTEQQLRKLALLSSPRVCNEYNNSICRSGSSCIKIHICCDYLRKSCEGTWQCGLEHESAFNTKQTQAVLRRLRMNSINTPDLLKLILESRRSLSSQDKTKCYIHVDKPNALICSSFLVDDCAKGIRCLNHHCSLPYHWQYKVPNVEAWNSFSDKDNSTLESLYCDINVDARMKFKPVEPLNFSLAESGVSSLAPGYTITIDLDDMIMFLVPLTSQGSVISQLRRLSTVDYDLNPCDRMPTIWTWYWKENGNIWRTYDKDCSGRDLQHLVEQAYQDYLKQGQVREKFRFATAEHNYNLFFYPSGMYQVNLKTATERRVRRRPRKVISSKHIEDLKWFYGDSSVREEVRRQLRAKNKYFLSHWSSMPPNASYHRTRVDPFSVEFANLEQLFRRTMNDYVEIFGIDRVQNPFMIEKYCRKKEKMLAAVADNHQKVNEKRLFHGTSSDAVEAICKQNFDWRLRGKNATRYGEGSYFARDASYSHAFTQKDAFGYHTMFVAKVLVGSYTKGHFSYRRPPPKIPSDPASDLYDSCVDNQSNPSIFAIFDTDQLYPEYIITYSTSSQLSSASTYHYSLPNPAISQTNALPRASVTPAKVPTKPSSSHQTQTLTETKVITTRVGPNPSNSVNQILTRTSATTTSAQSKSASSLTVTTPGQSSHRSAHASQSSDPRHHSIKASVGRKGFNNTIQSTSSSASGHSSSDAHPSFTEYSTSELPGLEKKKEKEKCLIS